MRTRLFVGVLVITVALLAGCSATPKLPKAVVPISEVDFGDVPVIHDMRDAKLKPFFIRNEGEADLTLGKAEVKTLEGC